MDGNKAFETMFLEKVPRDSGVVGSKVCERVCIVKEILCLVRKKK